MSAVFEGGGERDPFSLTANPDGYVPTANVGRVLGDANAALDEGRVPLVFGPAGLGKTLVLQRLGRERSDRSFPLYLPFCNLPPQELAALALGLLEQPVGDAPETQLLEEARRLQQSGRSLLLLVDDASALPGETAAQLAHWANASGGALQIALAGLPGPALRHVCDAFGDRADEILHAGGLRTEEIGRYVKARLEGASADPRLQDAFDERAIAELERVSEGNPRKLHLAAQAIVRNALHKQQVRDAQREGRGADASQVPARPPVASTAREIAQVGAYRFVGGRFLDPGSGAPLDEDDAFVHGEDGSEEDGLEPSGTEHPPQPEGSGSPWEHGRKPPGIDLTLASAPTPSPRRTPPAKHAEPDLEEDPWTRPVPPPSHADRPRLPYASIALGVVLVAFAVGLLTQLGGEDITDAIDVAEVTQAIERRIGAPAEREPVETPAADMPGAETPVTPERTAPEAPEETGPAEIAASESEAGGTDDAEAAGPDAASEAEAASDAPVDVVREDAVEAPAGAAMPEVDLPEVPAGPEDAPAEDVAPPDVAPVEPAAPQRAEVAPPVAETVSVSINATPWAVIEIDGEEVGETPLAGIELTTGRHRFRARMPDGDVRERVVRIDASNRTVVFE